MKSVISVQALILLPWYSSAADDLRERKSREKSKKPSLSVVVAITTWFHVVLPLNKDWRLASRGVQAEESARDRARIAPISQAFSAITTFFRAKPEAAATPL